MKFITLENLNRFWEGVKKRIPTKVSELTNDAGYLTNVVNITGNAGTATKLATARTITLTGDVSGSVSFNGSANVTMKTVAKDTVAKDNVITITKTLNIKTDWMDTGITGTSFENGMYAVYVVLPIVGNTCTEYYSGIMTWCSDIIQLPGHSGGGNDRYSSGNTHEILLHKASNTTSSSDTTIFLRTCLVNRSYAKLQIATNGNPSVNGANDVTFKFKKLI